MELLLEENEILDLGEGLRGVTVLCQQGCCWLTQSGDSRDHILHPGGRFTVQSKGQLLVTASAACRIRLQSETLRSPRSSFWRQLCCEL